MRGATLIELLVAMTLAGLAIAGALTGFSQLQRAWRDADIQGRLHERAQYAMATLEPELQMAGYYGLGALPEFSDTASLPAGATMCGDPLLLQLDRPVEVHAAWRLPCPAQGRGALPGNSVLIVRRVSVEPSAGPPGPLRVQGSVIPELRRIVWPGFPALQPAAPPPGTEWRDLFVRIYYVSRGSDGDEATPALRVKSLTAIAGQPAFIDTEVMSGVQEMQVQLLPFETSAQSVRVRLRVQIDRADTRAGETVPALTIQRRFSVRNATAT
jgi:hypothetical protein